MDKQRSLGEDTGDERIRRVAFRFAIGAASAAALVLAYLIFNAAVFPWNWPDVLEKHFHAIFGIPGAAVVAFVIVIFLRQADGPIEFEGLGFKFKGAAGQVVMWVVCFLAIAGAIKLVW